MVEAEPANCHSPSSNALANSTERVARWRARRRRGVLFIAGLEVFDRDLRLLKKGGYLATDDPEIISKAEVEEALGKLLDAVAERLGFS